MKGEKTITITKNGIIMFVVGIFVGALLTVGITCMCGRIAEQKCKYDRMPQIQDRDNSFMPKRDGKRNKKYEKPDTEQKEDTESKDAKEQANY